jgi:bis(5'-nucleosidyl)-tetraphosphatase
MHEQIISCGVVVYLMKNREIHYLLVKSKQFGFYGFPKGHVEGEETEEETALREVFEETGLTPTLVNHFKTQTSYLLDSGKMKTVIYFLGSVQDEKIKIQEEEISDSTLLPFEEAMNALNYENDREILKLADNYLKLNI